MTPEIAREEAIFTDALEHTEGAERENFVHAECQHDAALEARVLRLLGLHKGTGGFLETAPILKIESPSAGQNAEQVGTQIGPYTLLEWLGEGGAGWKG